MGQHVSFDAFYRAVFARLVGQLFLVTADQQEAQDLVQEAMARAVARWSKLCRYEAPELWVRRVALNLAVSRARRHRRWLAVLPRLTPPPPAPPASPEALALLSAMRELPIRQRQALVLHYFLDLPVDQIAVELSVPANSVKTWLRRGRLALAELLDDHAEPFREEIVDA